MKAYAHLRKAASDFEKKLYQSKRRRNLLICVLLLALASIPLFQPGQYFIRILSLIGIYAILALSLNLVTGNLGQISMGHAAFYCIGAYTMSLLATKLGWNFFPGALAGMITAGIGGLFLSTSTMRLSGSYLALTTLGFGEVVKMVALNWTSLTNGPLGIRSIPRPEIFGLALSTTNAGIYYLMLFLVSIVVVICSFINNSKMGRAVRAIKEDELAAKLMGVETKKYKVLTITISSAIAGLAGACYASLTRYIDPNTFNFDVSMVILSIVIFGGMGSIPGMLLGASILVSFPEILRFVSEYRFVIYGLILVIMMRFRPQGLLGGLKRTPYRLPDGVVAPVLEDNK